MIYLVLNDDQLECDVCGGVHEYLTRTIQDNCNVPAIFEEELMFKLLDEGNGTFLGGRAFPVPVTTEKELLNANDD